MPLIIYTEFQKGVFATTSTTFSLAFLLILFFFLKEIIVKGDEIDRFFFIFFLFKDAEGLVNYFQLQAEVVAAVYGYFG